MLPRKYRLNLRTDRKRVASTRKQSTRVSILIITGTVGVGKTTVARSISDILKEKSVHHALIDMDALRDVHPWSDSDPFYGQLGLKNLASIWKNFQAEGITHLIIPSVIENQSDVDGFQKAVPNVEICVVRLKAKLEVIHARLDKREVGESLTWHKNRAVQLEEILAREKVEDIIIDTENKPPKDIAHEILEKSEWLKSSRES